MAWCQIDDKPLSEPMLTRFTDHIYAALGGDELMDRDYAYDGIAKSRIPLKSVAGKMFPAFPAHAQPAVLCIW